MKLGKFPKIQLDMSLRVCRAAIIALALTADCSAFAKQGANAGIGKPVNSGSFAGSSGGLDPISSRILEIHNEARLAVGAPPLKWDPELTAHATVYAQTLAQTGQLIHSPREGRGAERENLTEAFHGSSPDQLMHYWLIEKRDFHNGIFPNVCSGDWEQCAHYTQVIWPTTTYVGCGLVAGVQWDFFVCRYSPGGNKDGKSVG